VWKRDITWATGKLGAQFLIRKGKGNGLKWETGGEKIQNMKKKGQDLWGFGKNLLT